jgi:hypothetical protein
MLIPNRDDLVSMANTNHIADLWDDLYAIRNSAQRAADWFSEALREADGHFFDDTLKLPEVSITLLMKGIYETRSLMEELANLASL